MTDQILAKLKEHDEAFKRHDEVLDNIIAKLIDHDGQLEDMHEKLKKLDLIDDLMAGQDKMIRILERIDHERAATKSAIDRHEARMARLEQHPALAS